MEDENKGTRRRQKVSFTDDLSLMLYAFGDSKSPSNETIDALEEYLLYFFDKVIGKALGRAERREGVVTKLNKDDILFIIKNDPKWMSRVAFIMERKIEISKIQKQIKSDEL